MPVSDCAPETMGLACVKSIWVAVQLPPVGSPLTTQPPRLSTTAHRLVGAHASPLISGGTGPKPGNPRGPVVGISIAAELMVVHSGEGSRWLSQGYVGARPWEVARRPRGLRTRARDSHNVQNAVSTSRLGSPLTAE